MGVPKGANDEPLRIIGQYRAKSVREGVETIPKGSRVEIATTPSAGLLTDNAEDEEIVHAIGMENLWVT